MMYIYTNLNYFENINSLIYCLIFSVCFTLFLFRLILNQDSKSIFHRMPKRRPFEKPIFSESPPEPPGDPRDPKNRKKTRRQWRKENEKYQKKKKEYELRKEKFYSDLEKYPFYNDPDRDSKILFYFFEYKNYFLILTLLLILTGNFGDW